LAWFLTTFNAGMRIPIRIAMTAITTSNSINVKPTLFTAVLSLIYIKSYNNLGLEVNSQCLWLHSTPSGGQYA
jgi:hypothetical protein